jgi:hypothetical protein
VTTRHAAAAGALGLQALVAVLFLAGTTSPLRAALAAAYLLLVPGWAVVGLLRLGDPHLEWPLAVATSVGLGTVVAQGLVWAGLWTPTLALALLAAVATPALALQLRPARVG